MSLIRPSRDSDLEATTAIYAYHVLHGTGTFETEPPTVSEIAARRADVLAKDLPFLVADADGEPLGFAYCNWFKPRPAFRYSAEDSIYSVEGARGRGLGGRLLAALSVAAEEVGIRKLIAVIGDSANAASIGVHRGQGFSHVGVITNCGWKFDEWRDVVFMEKLLGEGSSTRPE